MFDDLGATFEYLGGAGQFLLVWLPGGLGVAAGARVVLAWRRSFGVGSVMGGAMVALALVSVLVMLAHADLHRALLYVELDEEIEAVLDRTSLPVFNAGLAVCSLAAGALLVAWLLTRRPDPAGPRRGRLAAGLAVVAIALGGAGATLGLVWLDVDRFRDDLLDAEGAMSWASFLALVGSVTASFAAIAIANAARRADADAGRQSTPIS